MISGNKVNSTLVSHIYNSRKNIIFHIKEQGFIVSGYEQFSVNEVNAMLVNDQLDMIFEKTDGDLNVSKVYVKYLMIKTLRHNHIQEVVDDLFNIEELLTKERDTLILITKEDLNDRNTSELKFIWKKYSIFVVVIPIKHLQFNVLQHTLVPKHRVLSKEECEQVMKTYNMNSLEQFPEISRFDPVSKAIGIRPGQVCEITRKSKTAVESIYYRVCI